MRILSSLFLVSSLGLLIASCSGETTFTTAPGKSRITFKGGSLPQEANAEPATMVELPPTPTPETAPEPTPIQTPVPAETPEPTPQEPGQEKLPEQPVATPTPTPIITPTPELPPPQDFFLYFKRYEGEALFKNCLKIQINGGEITDLGCNHDGTAETQASIKALPKPYINTIRLIYTVDKTGEMIGKNKNVKNWLPESERVVSTYTSQDKDEMKHICIKNSDTKVILGLEDSPNLPDSDKDYNDYVVEINADQDINFVIENEDSLERNCREIQY